MLEANQHWIKGSHCCTHIPNRYSISIQWQITFNKIEKKYLDLCSNGFCHPQFENGWREKNGIPSLQMQHSNLKWNNNDDDAINFHFWVATTWDSVTVSKISRWKKTKLKIQKGTDKTFNIQHLSLVVFTFSNSTLHDENYAHLLYNLSSVSSNRRNMRFIALHAFETTKITHQCYSMLLISKKGRKKNHKRWWYSHEPMHNLLLGVKFNFSKMWTFFSPSNVRQWACRDFGFISNQKQAKVRLFGKNIR